MLNSSLEEILTKFSQTASTESEKAKHLLAQIQAQAQQTVQPYVDKGKQAYYDLRTQVPQTAQQAQQTVQQTQPIIEKGKETVMNFPTQIQQATQPVVQKGTEYSQDVAEYLKNLSDRVKAAFQTSTLQAGGQGIYIPYFVEMEQRLNPLTVIPLSSNQQQMMNQVLSLIITARTNPNWDSINYARNNIDSLYMQMNMPVQPWSYQIPLSVIAVPAGGQPAQKGGKDRHRKRQDQKRLN